MGEGLCGEGCFVGSGANRRQSWAEKQVGRIRGGLECSAQESGAQESHRQSLSKGRPSLL